MSGDCPSASENATPRPFGPGSLDDDGVSTGIEEAGLIDVVDGHLFSVDLDDIGSEKTG